MKLFLQFVALSSSLAFFFYFFHIELFANHQGQLDKVAIWTALLVVATALLAFFGYYQLKALGVQANVDFIYKLNQDFFGHISNKTIIEKIEEGEILLIRNGGKVSDYELDDYLGYFEMMSLFRKKGVIDIDLIDEMFGFYIEKAYKHQEISDYIRETREKLGEDVYYKPFEELAKEILKRKKGSKLSSQC